MPTKKTDSQDAPKITNDQSKKLLAAQLVDTKDTHFNDFQMKPVVIPSGSLKLDNYLKVKTGTVMRMGGPAEVGKTSQALLFADNFMKKLPNAKTFYVNAEAKFGEEIQKRTGMKFTTNASEWEYGSVFIFNSNCFDTVCDILVAQFKQIHEAGGHLCVIVDSVDMLRLLSSFGNKPSDNKKPAGVNFLTKEMFRHLCHPLAAYHGLLIMITQYSGTFSMSQYEQEAPSLMDGNKTHALNHQASVALYYRPRTGTSYIREDMKKAPDPIDNPILGINVKIDVRKSDTDQSGYTIEVPIKKGKTGNCIWVEKELFDALFLIGLVSKSGSWYTISDDIGKMVVAHNKPIEEANKEIEKENKGKKDADKKPLLPLLELKMKHQGLAQFSDYFESNKVALDWLVEKIRLWHS